MPDFGKYVSRLPASTPPELARALADVFRDLAIDGNEIKIGNQTATAGGNQRVDILFEQNTVETLASIGSIWPAGPVHTYFGISKEFSVEVTGVSGAPMAALFVHAVNNNNAADMCAAIIEANAYTNNDTAFGLNVIARNAFGTTGTKLVGLEIDIEPATGTTVSSSGGGLYINAFNISTGIPAIQIGGVGGGTFNNGLVIGGIASSGSGVSGEASASMGSLINTGSASYSQSAIILSNTHRIRFSGTSSTHASIYNDSSNNIRCVLGSGSWVFRNSADTVSNVSIDSSGNIDLTGGGGTLFFASGVSSTTATAGANALPANPVGFITVQVGGTNRKIPYYAT